MRGAPTLKQFLDDSMAKTSPRQHLNLPLTAQWRRLERTCTRPEWTWMIKCVQNNRRVKVPYCEEKVYWRTTKSKLQLLTQWPSSAIYISIYIYIYNLTILCGTCTVQWIISLIWRHIFWLWIIMSTWSPDMSTSEKLEQFLNLDVDVEFNVNLTDRHGNDYILILMKHQLILTFIIMFFLVNYEIKNIMNTICHHF